ncbi:MAG: prepilin-type N-terminal cleavage/methylation domain-containing protein, partial [Candidatus Binatia bacterium]
MNRRFESGFTLIEMLI